jgi:hypothetical protein
VIQTTSGFLLTKLCKNALTIVLDTKAANTSCIQMQREEALVTMKRLKTGVKSQTYCTTRKASISID